MDSQKIAYVVEDIYWSFRSPDLTQWTFFWGLPERSGINRSHTTEELKPSIHREITALPADMLNCTLRDMKN